MRLRTRNILLLVGLFAMGLQGSLFAQEDPLVPDWIAEFSDYQLPAWYANSSRHHIHTRLSMCPYPWKPANREDFDFDAPPVYDWMAEPEFTEFSGIARRIGTDVITRHVKSADEGAWWNSSVGAVLPPALTNNYAQDMIDRAHAEGLRFIAYYRHMEDAAMAATHESWICRDESGDPIMNRRGIWLCFNTPYVDFVETRLLELVGMGADGFYFDELHQPDACYCTNCVATAKNREDVIEDAFLQWRRAIHQANSNVVMLVSGRFEGLSQRLFRLADSVKIERGSTIIYGNAYNKGYALGLTFFRDAADGRPPHLWWNGVVRNRFRDVSRVLVHGGIFNHDLREASMNDALSELVIRASQHQTAASRMAPYMANTRPLRWALVHYPDGGESDKIIVRDFVTLLEQRVPSGIITDTQLAEGVPNECGLLVLPQPDYPVLTHTQIVASLAEFISNGGTVLTGPTPADITNAVLGAATNIPVIAVAGTNVQMAAYVRRDNLALTVNLFNEPGRIPETDTMLVIRNRPSPTQAFEALSGQSLSISTSGVGNIEVSVPRFETMAAVVLQWD